MTKVIRYNCFSHYGKIIHITLLHKPYLFSQLCNFAHLCSDLQNRFAGPAEAVLQSSMYCSAIGSFDLPIRLQIKLNVSNSEKQFMVSSILPKNERNTLSWVFSLRRIVSFVCFLEELRKPWMLWWFADLYWIIVSNQ